MKTAIKIFTYGLLLTLLTSIAIAIDYGYIFYPYPGTPETAIHMTSQYIGNTTHSTFYGTGGASNVTNGTGLFLSGITFSIAPTFQIPQTCSEGQIAKLQSGVWDCAADSGNGSNCSIDMSCAAISYDQEINKTYVDAQDSAQDECTEITGCVPAAITDANDSVESSELDTICSTNDKILYRSGGTWQCADDQQGAGDPDKGSGWDNHSVTTTATELDVSIGNGTLSLEIYRSGSNINLDTVYNVTTNNTFYADDYYFNNGTRLVLQSGSGDITSVNTPDESGLQGGALSADVTLYSNLSYFSSFYVNRSDWTSLDNYPASCSADYYVQSVGDTLTCVHIQNGSGDITSITTTDDSGLSGGSPSGDVTLTLNLSVISTNYVNRSDWTSLDNYPASCSADYYVQSVGDTLNCIKIQNDTDTNCSIDMSCAAISYDQEINKTYVDAQVLTKQTAANCSVGTVLQNMTVSSTQCISPTDLGYLPTSNLVNDTILRNSTNTFNLTLNQRIQVESSGYIEFQTGKIIIKAT